ncbi:MAG: fused MFS/spermidine synthase [bacterium]
MSYLNNLKLPGFTTNKIYYIVIFFTGAFSLVYQVIWQRYLNLLVGSEARSSTLIVSVFLLGLALGYYIFGLISIKIKEKRKLLKLYGYIELATGVYAMLFSQYFHFINNTSLANSSAFSADFILTFLLIFPPTILMGATIPIMTSVLPDDNNTLNRKHAIIYGLNTVGAFFGVIAGSLYLMNMWGLEIPLLLIGFLNFILSFVYIFNTLKGEVIKQDTMPNIQSTYSNTAIYLLAFISGLTSISLEIIWIRIWGMTIGSSYLIFPMVLSLFVLGLGVGSLTVKEISIKKLRYYFIWIITALMISFYMISYLPVWTNQLRVLFINHSASFYLYHVIVYLLLGVFLISFLLPMGRLLPTAYALLPKEKEKFGLQCGKLYFFNTLGTFLGAVILSYYLVTFYSLETIYKINIVLFGGLFLYFLFKDNKLILLTSVIICVFLFSIFITWDRHNHAAGLFVNKVMQPVYFTGLFKNHHSQLEVQYLKDGKNMTVAVANNPLFTKYKSLGIFVNGKPDSSTIKDFSTTSLIGALPYLYHTINNGLDVNVIGLGSGVTAGLLGRYQGVNTVDVIEISQAVIEALPFFSEETLQAEKNSKINIYAQDAFKFFRSTNKKYDIIASEPSNPWVVGIENLYTPYFYHLTKQTLNEKGILAQWIHMYHLDEIIFTTILSNILQEFEYANVFVVGPNADLLILASDTNISEESMMAKAADPIIQDIFNKIDIPSPMDLSFLHIFNSEHVRYIVDHQPKMSHTISFPTIAHRATKSFFLDDKVHLENLIDPFMKRHISTVNPARQALLIDHLSRISKDNQICRQHNQYDFSNMFCEIIFPHVLNYYNSQHAPSISDQIQSYSKLRNQNIIPQNDVFLDSVLDNYAKGLPEYASTNVFNALANDFISEWNTEKLNLLLNMEQTIKMVNPQSLEQLELIRQNILTKHRTTTSPPLP